MRTGLIVAGALIVIGSALAPNELNAGCRGCTVGYSYFGYAPGYYYAPAPTYYGSGQACYWRKVRHWDWDGQYWLVSRVQVCG